MSEIKQEKMNQDKIIEVKDLRKAYKTFSRGTGLLNAMKSLVKRKYETKEALKGISFNVNKGEILGLIGPNGAGKSTTIKALSGVLYPDSGTVKVMNFVPWKERVKYVKNIGVVLGQKETMFWDLPALDTFYLNKDIYGIDDEGFSQRLDYMLDLLDLREIAKIPIRDLSLGERMKCKIVAALLHNPALVFLDEPSIGLDVISKNLLRDFILKINKENQTTFIVTTHDMQEIERLCKRIIIINYGEIIYDGPLKDIKKKYLTNKIIDVKLETQKNHFEFKGCEVIEKRDYEMKIELDTKKQSIRALMNHLLGNYKIADVNISDPPIEEIIGKIFKKAKKDREYVTN